MQWKPFSPKQLSLITDSDAFINIADGPIRSGKTVGELIRWLEFCRTAPPGDLMLVAKSERVLKRNVIGPLVDIAGPNRIRHVAGAGELYVSGRRCYLVGANDESAEAKIRGSTLVGAYVNEATLVPQSAFNQLVGRLSLPGAKMFGDTNPDSPYHWLYKEWLTNQALLDAGDLKRWQFTLDDNWALSEEYKARLKRLYTGLWFERMILGRWVMAEGRVYDMFDPDRHVVSQLPSRFEQLVIGVDYGIQNATVFLMLGLFAGVWYVLKEYVYEGRETARQKSDAEYASDFQGFIDGYAVDSIVIDPSATSFIVALRHAGVTGVRQADNEVLDGIRVVGSALASDTLRIHESCAGLIESLSVYAWDAKAQQKGEDKPLKQNDHAADALRYACRRVFGRHPDRVVSKPRGL